MIGCGMSEPGLPPVNVKRIARVALALVGVAAAGIIILTFGPLRDRDAAISPVVVRGPGGAVDQSGATSGATSDPAAQTAGQGAAGVRPPADADKMAVLPSFDVVRVEPNGESVIGGRAAPDVEVELVLGQQDAQTSGGKPGDNDASQQDGKVSTQKTLQRGVTDRSGLFAMTAGPLKPGSHVLSLRTRNSAGGWTVSRQVVNVTIHPPAPPLVALVAPDRPSVLVSSPDQAPGVVIGAGRAEATGPATAGAEAGAQSPAVRIAQVETDDAGRLFVVGAARPGARLNLYLNDVLLGAGVANADGVAEFVLQSALPDGACRIRLDVVDPATGKVLSRAEAPWENPRGQARAGVGGKIPAASGKPAGLAEGAATTPPARTYVVEEGDSLWSISRKTYKVGARYTTIYDANQNQIRDASRIYPGQVFVLPLQGDAAAPGDGR